MSGANVVLRDATADDAEFILSLRLNPAKNQHMSATSPRLNDQVLWLQGYAKKTDQAYFIVCDKEGKRLGCVRLYDAEGGSYAWGSWLMVDGLSPLVSVETVLLVYAYGRHLGFKEARIDVRKDNKYVRNFHEKFFGAEMVSEAGIECCYVMREESIAKSLGRFSNLVTTPLAVAA
ncbi:MAG: GNAT family N-acetyltransferase [Rhizobacter sp.]